MKIMQEVQRKMIRRTELPSLLQVRWMLSKLFQCLGFFCCPDHRSSFHAYLCFNPRVMSWFYFIERFSFFLLTQFLSFLDSLLQNQFVLFFPSIFKVRAEFMPDTEENIWGHLLLSKFWFHEVVGCGLQKVISALARSTQMKT